MHSMVRVDLMFILTFVRVSGRGLKVGFLHDCVEKSERERDRYNMNVMNISLKIIILLNYFNNYFITS